MTATPDVLVDDLTAVDEGAGAPPADDVTATDEDLAAAGIEATFLPPIGPGMRRALTPGDRT